MVLVLVVLGSVFVGFWVVAVLLFGGGLGGSVCFVLGGGGGYNPLN